MRAGAGFSKFFDELGFKGRRTACPGARAYRGSVSLHAEDLRQHALDEVMPQRGPVGGLPAFGGKAHNSIGFDVDVSIALETFERHGDSGRRNR